jgi:tripeptide aminopeptidase
MPPIHRLISKEIAQNVLDLACHIQAIPAPTFQEDQRASYFLEQFRALGLHDIERDSTGNVLARLPGTAKNGLNKVNTRPLVVSAHMDTVHPLDTPLGLRRYDDRIAGPGIGDNALGLAAVLSLARLLIDKEQPLPGDLWLVINVGEEGLGDLRGIQAIVNRFGAGPLAYLVIEGMGLGTMGWASSATGLPSRPRAGIPGWIMGVLRPSTSCAVWLPAWRPYPCPRVPAPR